MKKIAVVTSGIQPVPASKGGAVETLVEYLISENEIQKKIDFCVYSIFDYKAEIAADKYKYISFKFVKVSDIIYKIYLIYCRVIKKIFKKQLNQNKIFLYKLMKMLKEERYDYVLIENRSEYVLPIARNIESKIILHLHNTYLNDSSSNGRKIANSCNTILTVSNFVKNEVLKIDKELESKVKVLENCTDVNKFNKKLYEDFRKTYRSENNINDNDIVIFFCGRLDKTKGIKELLIAFKNIELPTIKLLIVGSSWYGTNSISSYVQELMDIAYDIKDRIIFTGYINYSEMPKYYSVADISVVPSLWDEPAGLVVIEALSSGIPVIATNSGGIPEYSSNENTIFVEKNKNIVENLNAALKLLINDPSRRQSMGKNGREFSLQFNSRKYYECFCEIVGVK
jgi:spore coat protein SA